MTSTALERLGDPARPPYPVYAELLREGVLVKLSTGYALSSHAAITSALRDERFSSVRRLDDAYSGLSQLAGRLGLDDLFDLPGLLMLWADPPRHTRLRRIVGRSFTPRAIGRLKEQARTVLDEALNEMRDEQTSDVMEALAYPVPLAVIAFLLDVPASEQQQVAEWAQVLVAALDPNAALPVLVAAVQAHRQLDSYLDGVKARLRRRSSGSCLDQLVQSEDRGELSAAESTAMAILLLIAGHETTANLIGSGLLLLLQHPHELEQIRSSGYMEPAIEEMLRLEPPVQLVIRTALDDIEIDGERIPSGERVLLLTAGANRDPAAYDAPDVFNARRPSRPHLAFGSGMHHCLGAGLARMVGALVFEAIVNELPTWSVERVEWKPLVALRGPAQLIVTR